MDLSVCNKDPEGIPTSRKVQERALAEVTPYLPHWRSAHLGLTQKMGSLERKGLGHDVNE
jgi:hypothetical protein